MGTRIDVKVAERLYQTQENNEPSLARYWDELPVDGRKYILFDLMYGMLLFSKDGSVWEIETIFEINPQSEKGKYLLRNKIRELSVGAFDHLPLTIQMWMLFGFEDGQCTSKVLEQRVSACPCTV